MSGKGTYSLDKVIRKFRKRGRIVIVGASLAGLRAAEALRDKGFEGRLTIIGDEPHEPYDRPPLSKQVLKLLGEEALAYDPNPDDSQRQQVLRAVASCPVQAIICEIDPPADRDTE